MKKAFWHISSVDACEIVYCTTEEAYDNNYDGNPYGPFDTLTKCKKDALEYHRATITYARMAIDNIKNTKLKDFK